MTQDAKSQKDLTLVQKLRSLGHEVYEAQEISKTQQSGEVLAKLPSQLLVSNLLALPGWSRERLAHAIGVSPRTIRYWESGQSIPRPSHWKVLLDFFESFVNYGYKDYNVISIRINEEPLTPQRI
jgi:DNA-binding transcriptional regulator YiaG